MKIVYIILCLILLFGICVLLSWLATLFIDENREYDVDSRFYRSLLNGWTCFAVHVMRIHLDVEGLEKIPRGRFLLVQNHRSNFDPILTWYILRKQNVSFISKEENFHIFVFGKLIRRCCFRAIDRENPRNAIKTIADASQLLLEDRVSIGVYPEGTRNKHSEEVDLLPFHNGVLKIAQRAKVPIVVTTITGTETIAKNYPFHRSHVQFRVAEVISPQEIEGLRTDRLGERVQQSMLEQLKAM